MSVLTKYVNAEDFNKADPTSGTARNPMIPVEGTHIVRIENTRVHQSQLDPSNVFFIVDFVPLYSTSPAVMLGKVYSWVHNLANPFFGTPRLKQFIAAGAGYAPTSPEAKALTLPECDAIVEEGLLQGAIVRLRTSEVQTKSGRLFMAHEWEPASDDEKAKAAEMDELMRTDPMAFAQRQEAARQALQSLQGAPTETPAPAQMPISAGTPVAATAAGASAPAPAPAARAAVPGSGALLAKLRGA